MVVRSRPEIERALETQLLAIAASCESFDRGNRWEALRIATAICVVVHDGGRRGRSLLTQLGMKKALRFVSSGRKPNPHNLLAETPLVLTRLYSSGRGEYVPILDSGLDPHREMKFSEWWERDTIFRQGSLVLNRRRLAFVLRSQEGGSHFDPELDDESYIRLAREHLTTPRILSEGSAPTPLLGAELATMRQIAWELRRTLEMGGKVNV